MNIEMYKKKKGYQIGDILPLSITFVILAIALALGADVLDDIQGTQTVNSTAYNASGYGLSALNTFAKWMPTLALVIIIAVIIGVLIVYLANRFTNQ